MFFLVSKEAATFPSIPGLFELDLSVIMSSPHFLFADNETQKSVGGLSPNLTRHETYLNIHMETGVLVKAAKRIQFNTMLQKTDVAAEVDSLKNLSDGWQQIAPIFWIEEVHCRCLVCAFLTFRIRIVYSRYFTRTVSWWESSKASLKILRSV